MRAALCLLGCLLASSALGASPEGTQSAAPESANGRDGPLAFRIEEGNVTNAFYQRGPVAAHLLLSSGNKPRILAAFPAGNSGVGIWFDESTAPMQWTLGELRPTQRKLAAGRTLYGITANAEAQADRLVIRDAVLGSVRVLRDYQLGIAYPESTAAKPVVSGKEVRWARDRIDGAPGYAISLKVLDGQLQRGSAGELTLTPDHPGAPIRVRITALTGEKPLTPFAADALLNAQASDDLRARQALRFLSYQEKFLAGSWRFDTYFGRDTLMSLRLLMPALQPEAIEDGLVSVLERLNPQGEVAHEEDIGEFAILRHRKEGAAAGTPEGTAEDTPIHDYKMIDDDFMLAPVAAAWLLDHPQGRERAQTFLARKLSSGETAGAAIARNFGFVLGAARPFADDPVARNLLPLKPGIPVGQWRDSEHGLADGRYAYDVNAVWIPAALAAVARFNGEGLLAPYLEATQQQAFNGATVSARTWLERAPGMFEVRLRGDQAAERVRAYAAQTGVDPAQALASLPKGELRFVALSLDADLRPIPVLNSDVGFALLFTDPPPDVVETLVTSALRPFPAGLLTDVGMVTADPAYADARVQALFDRNAYHGTSVWSWHQAMMAAGLARQLQRNDLPATVRTRVRDAQVQLWRVIDASAATSNSELWTWAYEDGRYRIVPFGQGQGDADESNAAQLWSTVYLAIPRP